MTTNRFSSQASSLRIGKEHHPSLSNVLISRCHLELNHTPSLKHRRMRRGGAIFPPDFWGTQDSGSKSLPDYIVCILCVEVGIAKLRCAPGAPFECVLPTSLRLSLEVSDFELSIHNSSRNLLTQCFHALFIHRHYTVRCLQLISLMCACCTSR